MYRRLAVIHFSKDGRYSCLITKQTQLILHVITFVVGVFTRTQRDQDILVSAWIINISVLLSDHSILFAQMPGNVDTLHR